MAPPLHEEKMREFGSGQRPHFVDRRTEIVSGKRYGGGAASQIYATRSGSPDPPTPPPPAAVQSRRSNASAGKPWEFGDPEMKRKKRIARYKAYSVEGKVKATLKKGIRWIKNKCSQIVHGY